MNALGHTIIKLKNFWVISILIIVSFGIYTNTFDGEFVWDDRTLFIQNYDRWQWKNIADLLTRPDNLFGANDKQYYRPLPNLTFLMDRYIWGRNASGYHLLNIIFHTLSTITVFYIASHLLASRYAGLVASLLFAAHPVHTEAVAWINGRNNTISGFFYLLAFYYYIQYRHQNNRNALYYSLIAFAGSLFSKEYAITFPIVMLLYKISYSQNRLKAGPLTHMAIQWLPYMLVIIIYLLIRSILLPKFGAVPLHLDIMVERLLTVPQIFLDYLRLLILPVGLNALRDVSLVDIPWQFFLQAVGFLAFITIWITCYDRTPPVFFGMGWLLLTLLPVLNIVPLSNTKTYIAERYLYIPCFGFCLLAGHLFHAVFKPDNGSSRIRLFLAVFFLFGMVEAYGFETAKRNLVWRNELSLWKDTVKKSPDSFVVRTNLALALYAKGRMEEAHRVIKEAIRLNPNHDMPHFIRGVILYHKGLFHESMGELDKTLRINPNHADAVELLVKVRMKLRKGAGSP